MKTHHLLASVALLVAASAAAIAQEPGLPATGKPPAPAKTEPQAVPALTMIAANAPLNDASGAALGTIRDHVIDCESGHIAALVVDVKLQPEGSKTVLLPFTRCTWDAAKKTLVARATAAELAALPEHAKDAGKGDVKARPAGADAKMPREVHASELLACPVKAQTDALGSAHALLMDPAQGTVAMVLVLEGNAAPSEPARPAGEYLPVPWKAMKFQPQEAAAKPDDKEQGCLLLGKRKDELAAAPRIKGADPRAFADAELYEKIHKFYGVSTSVAPRRAN